MADRSRSRWLPVFDPVDVLPGWSLRRSRPWTSTPVAGLSTRAQVWLVIWTAWWVLALMGVAVALAGWSAGLLVLFASTSAGAVLVQALWERLARRLPVAPGFAAAHAQAVELARAFRAASKGGKQGAAAALDAHLDAHPELDGGCWRREFRRIRAQGVTLAA